MISPNNKDFGYFLQLIFVVIFILAGALACASIWPKNGINIDYKVQIAPTPKATATPNAIFTILVERARAAATVEIIRAEANSESQATDDEIKLRWNIHLMRRFWAWWFIPILAIITTIIWLKAYKK